MSSYSSVTRSPEPSLFHSLVVQDDRDSQFGAVPLRNPFHADSALSTMFELDTSLDVKRLDTVSADQTTMAYGVTANQREPLRRGMVELVANTLLENQID